jgi:hypothetical protein
VNRTNQLARAVELREYGVPCEAEFEAEKARLFARSICACRRWSAPT